MLLPSESQILYLNLTDLPQCGLNSVFEHQVVKQSFWVELWAQKIVAYFVDFDKGCNSAKSSKTNPLFPSSFQHFCRISPWNRRWLMGWCRVWSWRPTAINVPYVLMSVELFLCFDVSWAILTILAIPVFWWYGFSYSCVLMIWVKLFLCFDLSNSSVSALTRGRWYTQTSQTGGTSENSWTSGNNWTSTILQVKQVETYCM